MDLNRTDSSPVVKYHWFSPIPLLQLYLNLTQSNESLFSCKAIASIPGHCKNDQCCLKNKARNISVLF